MIYTLPNLAYDYNALEPHFDEMTMRIHHTKHHQAYITNLNAALDKEASLKKRSLTDLLVHLDSLPESVRTAIRNNGGGHFNHELFWTLLTPQKGLAPKGNLLDEIIKTFGSLELFKEEFANAAKGRFGSGWAWLIVTPDKKLKVTSTANQDTPLLEGKPILALDVWEHAYYLHYQNRRPDYINAFWNIVNWNRVEELFTEAIK